MNYNLGVSQASSIDYFFSSSFNTVDQMDSMSNNALSRGIDRFTKKDYAGAVREFRLAIGLSPSSSNTSTTYDYLAKAFLQQNNTDAAIKTYKTAAQLFSTDDTFHLSLGDLYFKNKDSKNATMEYSKAVKLNPSSADNRYSLGEIYLTMGNLSGAKEQFLKVTKLAPKSPTGFYGLGQTLRASGDYGAAVVQLAKAVSLNKTFANAFLELGYAYADLGSMDKANEQLDRLHTLRATQQATGLKTYIAQATNPKIIAAFSTDGFQFTDGMGTALTDLNSALSTPNIAVDFTINFIFSKEMDKSSVENVANWQIGRQSGPLISNTYNFGLPVPSTEVNLPAQPTNVVYDSQSNSASVTFTVSQNGYGNGTIDPSHVYFLFKGKDTYGKIMDHKADEYSGFSKII